ncbi:TetR/AcrR family transcriptional regulator [Undibacterium sp. RuTC16W]|uniref:TetR/AcrR family transcriptional regulator n=1 Tax=Undibacterium sp. RuTC16W TaxID=3413048 RepID=UPI003BF0C9D2
MKSEQPENHRTRVGAERREKARARLLESALLVFANKGPESAVIDEVIALAGMSRGSFYNYFRTNKELLEAVAEEISNELLDVIDPVVLQYEDPVVRITYGCRLLLHAVRDYPLLGNFLSRLHWPTLGKSLHGITFISRDIEMCVAQDKFLCTKRVAFDLMVGATFGAVNSLVQDNSTPDYPEAMLLALLRGLGVEKRVATRLAAATLPTIVFDDQSILQRTLERARTQVGGSGKS